MQARRCAGPEARPAQMRRLVSLGLLVALAPSQAAAVEGASPARSPLLKTLELLETLQGALKRDQDRQQEAYSHYASWCNSTLTELQTQVQTRSKSQTWLEASLGKAKGDSSDASGKAERLGREVEATKAKLAAAAKQREQEAAAYEARKKQLAESGKVLANATTEVQKNLRAKTAPAKTAALLQSFASESAELQEALTKMGDVADLTELLAMDGIQEVESKSQDAPSSSSVVKLLSDMQVQATKQLKDLDSQELKARKDFQQLQASFQAEISAIKQSIDREKIRRLNAESDTAKLGGDLSVSTNALQQASLSLKEAKAACSQAKEDHTASVRSYEEEVKVLKEAGVLIRSLVGSIAEHKLYSSAQVSEQKAVSFLQVASHSSALLGSKSNSWSQARGKAVTELLSHIQLGVRSKQMAGVLSRLKAAVFATVMAGKDPFEKVKKMIKEMMVKLETEALQDEKEKAYCDREMNTTLSQIQVLQRKDQDLKINIDKLTAASTELKQQVAKLQEEIRQLEKEQQRLDRAREEAHEAYMAADGDLQNGLQSLHRAIRILREFYTPEPASSTTSAPIDGVVAVKSATGSLSAGSTGQLLQAGDFSLPSPPADLLASSNVQKSLGQFAELGDLGRVSGDEGLSFLQLDLADEEQPTGEDEVLMEEAAAAVPPSLKAQAPQKTQEGKQVLVQASLSQEEAAVQVALKALAPPKAPTSEARFNAPAVPAKYSVSVSRGATVIRLLEQIESDFAKSLTKGENEEGDAQAEYQRLTKRNKVAKEGKSAEIKYLTREFQGLDKNIVDLTKDKRGVENQLKAAVSYLEKVKDRCILKPETEAELRRKAQAEINSLKEALGLLRAASKPSFLQVRPRAD